MLKSYHQTCHTSHLGEGVATVRVCSLHMCCKDMCDAWSSPPSQVAFKGAGKAVAYPADSCSICDKFCEACKRQVCRVSAGLSFAGVHDSFWTHAGSVETMNNILREKFFELHSQPLLENLRNELQQLYPKLDIPEVPQLGSLDLNKITEADYFFN